MDSNELMNLFIEAQSKSNSIERYLFLQSHKQDYKKSEFYKKTHIPIFKAYNLVTLDTALSVLNKVAKFTNPVSFGIYIQDVIESIEPEAIEEFIEKMTEAFNTEEIIGATKDIKEQISNLIK
jgi:hypothetical protein